MRLTRLRQALALSCSFTMLAAQVPLARAADVAQDIDVYALPARAGSKPNVLIIIDNSANWEQNLSGTECDEKKAAYASVTPPTGGAAKSWAGWLVKRDNPDSEEGTRGGALKCALYKVVKLLADRGDLTDSFNMALMMFNESPDSSGYPRLRFFDQTANPDGTGALPTAAEFLDEIEKMSVGGDKTNNASSAAALYEAFRWFQGGAVYLGMKTATKHDPGAFTNSSKTDYRAPGGGPSCAQNHIIYIANGKVQDNNTTTEELLRGLDAASATRIKYSATANIDNPDEANWSDEFARYFAQKADLSSTLEGQQGITTHTIAVIDPKTGNPPNFSPRDRYFPNFMRAIANEGGGTYQESTDAQSIASSLLGTLDKIKAVNSVFAAASLPVSANTQGTYLNQVFIGLFRPEPSGYQRWVGNLKQYQFIFNAGKLVLGDAATPAKDAINPNTGFIVSDAQSFWSSTSTYWTGHENMFPTQAPTDRPSDAPDGEWVEKGGAAQWLRSTYATDRSTRRVLTCRDGASGSALCSSATSTSAVLTSGTSFRFNAANVVATDFGASVTDAQRDSLVNWLLGGEVTPPSASASTKTPPEDQLFSVPVGTVRPSIHGDVLHGRPVAVNYDGKDGFGVVVYYGSNDGLLRAINGNQTAAVGTYAPGSELWAFVAPEHYSKLGRLQSNQPQISFPLTLDSLTPAATERDYFFDGPVGLYQTFTGTPPTVSEVFIYAAMRRGGRAVYAFDVSVPDAPKLLWKVNNNTSGFGQLGETWSQPKVIRVKGQTDPVLIFGGGYDPLAEDRSNAMPDDVGTTNMGNRIYVLNIRTGALLAALGGSGVIGSTDGTITGSVPSDLAVVDTDSDGYIDRVYFNDIRAGVYRLDIENAASEAITASRTPANWTITKFANLANSAAVTVTNPDSTTTTRTPLRKFFFSPDVVVTRDFVGLFIGSGDREKPQVGSAKDRFYFIKDNKVTKGPASSTNLYTITKLGLPADEPNLDLITDDSLDAMSVSTNANSSLQGCYFELNTTGERTINQPVTFGGRTYFSTNRPVTNPNSCVNSESIAYSIPVFCTIKGLQRTVLKNEGLAPSPVVGFVEVDGKLTPFIIGGPQSTSAIGASEPPIPIPTTRKRTYWYMENKDR